MKIIYTEVINNQNIESKFDNVKDFKDFMNKNPDPWKFSSLVIEKDGNKEILAFPVILGDEGYKSNYVKLMSQEDLNKYRPYFDRYEITPAGYSNSEITESFILANIMKTTFQKTNAMNNISKVQEKLNPTNNSKSSLSLN